MKLNKDFHGVGDLGGRGDEARGHKLPPAKKSGKERYELYSELEEDGEFDAPLPKKESVFDYFDDEEDDL